MIVVRFLSDICVIHTHTLYYIIFELYFNEPLKKKKKTLKDSQVIKKVSSNIAKLNEKITYKLAIVCKISRGVD